MESEFKNALTETVREWSRATTPEDLKARGVRRLRSVNLAEMAFLVEKAVNRTLLARTIGEASDDMADAARGEFMRLMSDRPPKGDSLETKATTELERLKAELTDRRLRQTALISDDAVRQREKQLESKLRSVFERWQGEERLSTPLEDEVIRVAMVELHEELTSLKTVEIDKSTDEINLLERRIAKLCKHLGQTEEELARVLRMKDIDPGVASLYRTVQGLSPEEDARDQKAKLMNQIFDANVKLREDRESDLAG